MREYDYEFRTMGCEASISLVAPDQASADAACARMRAHAHAYDARFSRFSAESELSRLNRLGTLAVSQEFMDVFLVSRELSRRTGGRFNPLMDISRFGYDADISDVRERERATMSPSEPYDLSVEAIEIDPRTRTITLRAGQRLDFGGIVKGYAAERIALSEPDMAGVIVNLGGDIFTTGSDPSGAPFTFSVDDPTDSERDIDFFGADEAVATSGTYARSWLISGVPTSHILGASGTPLSGSDVISSTVRAKTGAEADALAKIPLVAGAAEGARILASMHVPYCLIRADGTLRMSDGFIAVPQHTHDYA